MFARLSRRTCWLVWPRCPPSHSGLRDDRTTAGPISTADTLGFANASAYRHWLESVDNDDGVRVFRLSVSRIG